MVTLVGKAMSQCGDVIVGDVIHGWAWVEQLKALTAVFGELLIVPIANPCTGVWCCNVLHPLSPCCKNAALVSSLPVLT